MTSASESKTSLANALNDHTTTLVPIETWTYQSPLLRLGGAALDMGLLAEALIYYDRVLVAPASDANSAEVISQLPAHPSPPDVISPPALINFAKWFVDRDELPLLLALLRDGTLKIYHYAFQAVPILHEGVYNVFNAQDSEEAAGDTFMRRVAGHPSLHGVISKARQREQLYRALEGQVSELHVEEFSQAVDNARRDFESPAAVAHTVQALVDHIRPLIAAPLPDQIVATLSPGREGRTNVTWNVDFRDIDAALAPQLRFTVAMALIGLVQNNRTLWSAAREACDLYLPPPLSALASLKLAETNERRARPTEVIQTLQREVDFPDVRALVNAGAMTFDDVLKLRRHAKRFRLWLQTQADRDTDALVAYHHEVARESGFMRGGRATIRLFGMLSGAGVGAYAASQIPGIGVVPAAVAAAVGGKLLEEGTKYLFDVAGKLDEGWKPVVFGNWAREYTERATSTRK